MTQIQYKVFITSAFIVLGVVLTVALAFSAEALSALASVNPMGVLAAGFAAVVGFVWLVRKNR